MTTDNSNHSNHVSPEGLQHNPPSNAQENGGTENGGALGNLLKHRLAKPIGIGVLAVILLVIVVNLFSGGGSGGKDNILYKGQNHLTYSVDGEDTVFLNGNRFDFDDQVDEIHVSLNQQAAAVLTEYSYAEGGTLWYLNGKNKIEVADGVVSLAISHNGNAIAYITDYDSDYESGTLYLFDGKKSEVIDHDVYILYYQISPDGKSVAYMKDVDTSSYTPEMTAYVKIGGKKPEKLGDNVVPLAIADSGKYIYYVELDDDIDIGNIYVKKGKKETRLRARTTMDEVSLSFNADYSQVLIRDSGKLYLSTDGGETVSLGRGALGSPVSNAASRTNYDISSVYAVKDLAQLVFFNPYEQTFLKADRSGDLQTLARNVSLGVVIDYADAVVYLDNRNRIIRKALNNPNAEEQVLAKDAYHFVASPDAKIVYYVDYDDVLYVVKGNSEPVRVAEDVASWSPMISHDGKYIAYLTDYRYDSGTLYVAKLGGKPVELDDDVRDLIVTPEGLYYTKNYDDGYFELYFNKKFSGKSELIEQEAEDFGTVTSSGSYSYNRWYDF